ncbi:hypothetical protein WAF17_01180 [Bernardetia sp. ABR2-2B]|uniref:hypothetical protein n=1 Tax=Bernardetia sp. ABR2-2B TaxID=3127472 RepID=UPI0030D230F4
MNIHKIDSHLHNSFLEEERKDAITGDLIQANDEVVFCGICKSAFLKDSWEYMDRKHCGQTKTLHSVPISKPLLLNVSFIKPHFITLTNSYTSFEKSLKLLSTFHAKDKKVNIELGFVSKKDIKEYTRLVEKAILKVKKRTKKKIEQERKIEEDKIASNNDDDKSLLIFCITLLVIFFISIGVIYLIPKGHDVFKMPPILIALITGFFIIALLIQYIGDLFKKIKLGGLYKKMKLGKRKKKNKIPKRISFGNLESRFRFKHSITFGIFNYNIFLYFEDLQHAIFVELSKVSKVEIKYKAHCYILLILKSYEIASQEIEIPLVFTKNSRITNFLMKLASYNKEISKPSKIIVTNFPVNQKKILQNSIKVHPDIIFIENEHSQNR